VLQGSLLACVVHAEVGHATLALPPLTFPTRHVGIDEDVGIAAAQRARAEDDDSPA
jgi:hypothetical protein